MALALVDCLQKNPLTVNHTFPKKTVVYYIVILNVKPYSEKSRVAIKYCNITEILIIEIEL